MGYNSTILSNKFFSQCKLTLRANDYESLIETFQMCCDNKISKEEANDKIGNILQNHPKLLKDFKKVFPCNENYN